MAEQKYSQLLNRFPEEILLHVCEKLSVLHELQSDKHDVIELIIHKTYFEGIRKILTGAKISVLESLYSAMFEESSTGLDQQEILSKLLEKLWKVGRRSKTGFRDLFAKASQEILQQLCDIKGSKQTALQVLLDKALYEGALTVVPHLANACPMKELEDIYNVLRLTDIPTRDEHGLLQYVFPLHEIPKKPIQEGITKAEMDMYSEEELEDVCNYYRLKSTGTKDELIERILVFLKITSEQPLKVSPTTKPQVIQY